jgi:orotate phosphoribosyltransferase
MEQYKRDFIDFMTESGVLTFGDFVTKSGRRTPYFINTGNYLTGRQIARLGHFYAECIENTIGRGFDILFGPAYKGIPIVCAAAAALYSDYGVDRRYCFNRKEAKDHGEGGVLIGAKPKDGDRVVIVEDVMTAGTSIRESVPLLKAAAKVEIPYVVISVDRMERGVSEKNAAQEIYDDLGVAVRAIVTIRDIIEHMRGKIDVSPIEAYLSKYQAV